MHVELRKRKMYLFYLCFGIISFLCSTSETRRIIRQEPTDGLVEMIGVNNSSLAVPEYNLIIDSSSTASTVVQRLSTPNQKNETQVVGVIGHKYRMLPMAVGGITLLAGLLTLFVIVGLFMYFNRNTDFVYQSAATADIEHHI